MSLNKIVFPDGLAKIDDYAFHRCHSLKAAVPDSVYKLGKCAFLYCDGMEKGSLGGVKRIERQTFANCTSLLEIRLNSSLETDNLGDDILRNASTSKKSALQTGKISNMKTSPLLSGRTQIK